MEVDGALFLVLLLSGVKGACVLEDDYFEPNNEMNHASPANLGDFFVGLISRDDDWFKIDIPTSQTADITFDIFLPDPSSQRMIVGAFVHSEDGSLLRSSAEAIDLKAIALHISVPAAPTLFLHISYNRSASDVVGCGDRYNLSVR